MGLPAPGPAPDRVEKLRLFGQFVGDWDIVDPLEAAARTDPSRRIGEVHFNWVLGGRAIQDVWGPVDTQTGRFVAVGTTLRYYDPGLDAWRSTWISPLQREVRRFIGRSVDSEIVLQEEPRGLRTERWIFSDLTPESFRWRAVRRLRPSGPWTVVEEMALQRRR